MRVDGERAADAEVAVRLHHGRREAERVERLDDVAPARTRACAIGLRPNIRNARGRCERARNAVTRQALPAHGMPRATHRDGTVLRSGIFQKRAKLREDGVILVRTNDDVLGDGRGAQPARVVEDNRLRRGLRFGLRLGGSRQGWCRPASEPVPRRMPAACGATASPDEPVQSVAITAGGGGRNTTSCLADSATTSSGSSAPSSSGSPEQVVELAGRASPRTCISRSGRSC